ncbi:MAG: hypothetical protein KC657_08025 [Myxococcales bacterium]|nr:hypothetical protein [Myxococcales bacterium]
MARRRGLWVLAVAAALAMGAGCSSASKGQQCAENVGASAQALGDYDGRCTGTARSCYSMGAGQCHLQPGCSVDIGRYDTPSDDRCRGYPHSCSSRMSKGSCEDVRGCTWTPKSGGTTSSGSSGDATGDPGAPASGAAGTSPCASDADAGGPTSPGAPTDPAPSPTTDPAPSGSSGSPSGSSGSSGTSGSSSSGGSSSGDPGVPGGGSSSGAAPDAGPGPGQGGGDVPPPPAPPAPEPGG